MQYIIKLAIWWCELETSKAVLLLRIFYISVLYLLCLCARLFIYALWSPAGKGLTSWLLFVVYNCEFVTCPLVSWVRWGTWLYLFLMFAPLLTWTECLSLMGKRWFSIQCKKAKENLKLKKDLFESKTGLFSSNFGKRPLAKNGKNDQLNIKIRRN